LGSVEAFLGAEKTMLNACFSARRRGPLRVLCLGAHGDDIEIGCGGTVLKLIETQPAVAVKWVVFSATLEREKEALRSANAFLGKALERQISVEKFRDGFFPYIGKEIKEYFEQLKKEVAPDLVLTHCRADLHQDHRLISHLTYNTFRDQVILEYEIPKYDGDLGAPNVYWRLTEAICKRKVGYIERYFKSQRQNHWFDKDTFLSIMRIRGVESNAPERFAEAFYCRKMVLV
jgi:LmbE family N-acetylglucosaminyl deacetylase